MRNVCKAWSKCSVKAEDKGGQTGWVLSVPNPRSWFYCMTARVKGPPWLSQVLTPTTHVSILPD